MAANMTSSVTSPTKTNSWPAERLALVILLGIMLLSLGLHLYNIGSIQESNAYYTAAVKSMLVSWKNFFFVAAEPGGSVTVDKPPLGLWIETAFAYFLGVSGFSTSLPNILAGVLGIPLLYSLVKKYMGALAGLTAALVMALTPVFVAADRNNTQDGLLVFFLLLAAWAFMRATESGSLRWLLLGAVIVGLGFNIKMLQAFLPLPAFYALYFFGAKAGWLRKSLNLGLATLVLVAVSLSWAVAVDLVPADQRPFIGSSENNTVMGLIFGHNGVSRLGNVGSNQPGGGTPGGAQQGGPNNFQPGAALQNAPAEALAACAGSSLGTACSFNLANGETISGECINPPQSSELACAPQGGPGGPGSAGPGNSGSGNTGRGTGGQGPNGAAGGGQGGAQFAQETGSAGVLRFFISPLSRQMSWLLPFALLGGLLALCAARVKLPIEAPVHKALVLWGGWLLTCVVFFSMVSGIFHAYYAIMLAPALGAVVGIVFGQLWDWGVEKRWAGWAMAGLAAVTLVFQYYSAAQYGETSPWLWGGAALFVLGALLLFAFRSAHIQRMAYLTLLAAMLVIPGYWTVMTAATSPDVNLPTAYKGSNVQQAGMGQQNPPGTQTGQSALNADMLAFLQANTQDVEYLAAVPSSGQQGAQLVLASGRPVLYIGGFGGWDQVVSAQDLQTMVSNGEMRYIYYSASSQDEIGVWLQNDCTRIPEFSETGLANSGQNQGPAMQAASLYECR